MKKGQGLFEWKNICMMLPEKARSGSIVRSSIPAFRAEDPGPNPGRSTNYHVL
jgi:hypothetical protein